MEKLLTKPVFQRHMTAVREVLNMLRAAQKIRKDGESWMGKALEVVISFVHRRWSDSTSSLACELKAPKSLLMSSTLLCILLYRPRFQGRG